MKLTLNGTNIYELVLVTIEIHREILGNLFSISSSSRTSIYIAHYVSIVIIHCITFEKFLDRPHS